MTYQATFTTGWRATLRAESLNEARKRFRTTGRGERFRIARVADAAHRVWGNDKDDDYEDGE